MVKYSDPTLDIIDKYADELDKMSDSDFIHNCLFGDWEDDAWGFCTNVAKFLYCELGLLQPPKIIGPTVPTVEEARKMSPDFLVFPGTNWWLKDKGTSTKNNKTHVARVDYEGIIDEEGSCADNYLSIRPAVNIVNGKVDDYFFFGGQIFRIITPDLAVSLYSSIGDYEADVTAYGDWEYDGSTLQDNAENVYNELLHDQKHIEKEMQQGD